MHTSKQTNVLPERLLMGPGPSSVPPDVLAALSQPTLGHLDPAFIELMDEVRTLLQYAFVSESPHVFTLSAPGSAGMEACVVNLVEPGDPVAVCINGVFGQRMAEVSRRAGARVHVLEVEWGSGVPPEALDELLSAHPEIKLAGMVHAETSTGACSDVAALAEVCRRHECLSVVDAVTSLGGIPLKVDDWGLDAVYSGSQKCLSCVPGLSPVVLSERAWERIESRTSPVQSWFLDFALLSGYWGTGNRRAYHHTAPVNSIYAWHRALTRLHEEGLTKAWVRHAHHHQALAAGLAALGLDFVVDSLARLPQLNSVWVPAGVDEAGIRARLLNVHQLEIGAGLAGFAGKVWRIGLMGFNASNTAVLRCLDALGQCLIPDDPVAARAGCEAAEVFYANHPDALDA
jgi:alanine-glyoxylate transaminase/serine-glyoxylate transaminase/serine-pyruvate transaminase